MYDYKTERPKLFTEEGSVLFMQIRDHVQRCLNGTGAVMMSYAVAGARGPGVSDNWLQMACVDRLVELGELREIPRGKDCHGQDRVFIGARSHDS